MQISFEIFWIAIPLIVFAFFGLSLSIVDLRTFRLPNRQVAFATGLIALTILIFNSSSIWQAIFAGSLTFLIFLIMALVSKASLGFGDVKYSFICGAVVGCYSEVNSVLLNIIRSIWVMFLMASIFHFAASSLKSFRHRGAFRVVFDKSARLAFAPYLTISTIWFATWSLLNSPMSGLS